MNQHLPKTLDGLKRQAWKLKKETGCRYCDALEQIARKMGYAHYSQARRHLAEGGAA